MAVLPVSGSPPVLRVSGEDLKVAVSDTDTGVFFRPEAGGSEVRVDRYIDNTEEIKYQSSKLYSRNRH
ncbi:MAG: hypothetical protein GDA56_29975 [Hormoscilla sp. GM7CHS1pb]|nr:hypothetical protein [Hormoscilla sp. GM7CHS1pb]